MRFPLFVVLSAAFALSPAAAEEINLAKPPQSSHGNEPASAVTAKPTIMINKATEAELLEHEQFGPDHAKRVIANRPYDGPEDFRTRGGLPAERFDKVKELLEF